jgi:hypothetical protein
LRTTPVVRGVYHWTEMAPPAPLCPDQPDLKPRQLTSEQYQRAMELATSSKRRYLAKV